jgi:hypothetical protein
VVRTIMSSFFLYMRSIRLDFFEKDEKVLNWMEFFYFLTNFMKSHKTNEILKFDESDWQLLFFKSLGSSSGKVPSEAFFIKNYFLSRITPVVPLFSYFVNSVDKNVRKYSRGKSGKYSFVWRYIPSYKRTYLTFRWVLKDIRFSTSKTFDERLVNSFFSLTNEPEKSFAWKSKNYTYAYIFKNFRKTLMQNLRTTSK